MPLPPGDLLPGAGGDPALELAARALDQSANYLVLRRIPRPARYHPAPDDGALRLALYVDVETTGLDCARDAIIQFCGVPFEFAPASGAIHRVFPAISGYEDPGAPIPEIVVRKTGITDAMVAGQRLDDEGINAALEPVVLVIAHNAAFDRPFVDRRLPRFAMKHWACSFADVPWSDHGFDSGKLEFLLFKHARAFYDAHRADEDCFAGIHLLATPLPNGDLPMRLLLEQARRPMWRLCATDAPRERNTLLKQRGYRWNPARYVWWRDVAESDCRAEIDWLRAAVYERPDARPALERLDPRRRFAT